MEFNDVFTSRKYEDHLEWLKDDTKGNRLDLSGVNLRRVDLSNANLSGANLSNAVLSGTNLSGANLENANLTNVRTNGAIGISIVSGADWSGARP